MDNEKKYTERDLILARRAAYAKAVVANAAKTATMHRAQEIADALYPLPPMALGKFGGRVYRLRDDVLEYQTRTRTPICGGEMTDRGGAWDRASLQPEDVRSLAAALEEIADAD